MTPEPEPRWPRVALPRWPSLQPPPLPVRGESAAPAWSSASGRAVPRSSHAGAPKISLLQQPRPRSGPPPALQLPWGPHFVLGTPPACSRAERGGVSDPSLADAGAPQGSRCPSVATPLAGRRFWGRAGEAGRSRADQMARWPWQRHGVGGPNTIGTCKVKPAASRQRAALRSPPGAAPRPIPGSFGVTPPRLHPAPPNPAKLDKSLRNAKHKSWSLRGGGVSQQPRPHRRVLGGGEGVPAPRGGLRTPFPGRAGGEEDPDTQPLLEPALPFLCPRLSRGWRSRRDSGAAAPAAAGLWRPLLP